MRSFSRRSFLECALAAGVAVSLPRFAFAQGGASAATRMAEGAAMLTAAQQAARRKSAAEVAALGEPWLTYFDPDVLADDLRALGFGALYDLKSAEANERYFSGREDGLRVSTGRLMKARV